MTGTLAKAVLLGFLISATLMACDRSLDKVANPSPPPSTERPDWMVRAGYHLFKAGFYPVAAPVSIVRRVRETYRERGVRGLWRAPLRVLRADGLHALGWFFLFLQDRDVAFSFTQFNDETREFDEASDDANVVTAELIRPGEALHDMARFFFEARERRNKFYVSAATLPELHDQLKAVRARAGRIDRLEIFVHGSPGQFGMGENRTSAKTTNAMERWNDVMAKGAVVRLISCFVGNGEVGARFAESLGALMLDRGGVVLTSKLRLAPDLADHLAFALGVPARAPLVWRRSERYLLTWPRATLALNHSVDVEREERSPRGADRVRRTVIGEAPSTP